jgi:RND family efflux transporter MFP subunit
MEKQNENKNGTQAERPQEQHNTGAPGHGETKRISGGGALLFLLVMLIVAAVICTTGIILRVKARSTVAGDTNAIAAPDVTAEKPQMGVPDQEVVEPGNMYAYTDSPIYARTSGYLEKWYYDIGAHVKKGALLATISSPEVDQQLAQAKANLATAEANAGYAQTTANRYQNLLKSDAVSKQDTENFTTQAQSSNTAVQAAQAAVQQYQALTSFEKVYAPFSGVITSRAVDVGQLIDSGANRELFHMAQTDVLRVYINVPQAYMRDAVKGVKAELDLAEYPGQQFTGTIVRTADAIDPASRTLLTEVDVNNHDGRLVPGAYTIVHLKVSRSVETLVLPVSCLIFQSQGLQVATLVHGSNGDQVKMVKVVMGRDDGKTVQIVSGLDANALVINNPPDSLTDNELVHLVQPRGPVPNQPGQNQQAPPQGSGKSSGKGGSGKSGDSGNSTTGDTGGGNK